MLDSQIFHEVAVGSDDVATVIAVVIVVRVR